MEKCPYNPYGDEPAVPAKPANVEPETYTPPPAPPAPKNKP